MRRLTGVLLSLFSAAASADTVTYLAHEAWGKTWHDADKAFDGLDENLCWAAAASNVLSYNEWSDTGVPAAQSEDAIFQEFKDHWANEGGRVDLAWYWWMYGGWFPDVDVPGGGGYWPDGSFPIWPAAYASYSGSVVYEPGGSYYFVHDRLMDFANLYLHMGYGAAISIHHPGWTSSHAITLWGFDYDTVLGAYTGIYYTDSDDRQQRLAWSSISLNQENGHPTMWALYGSDLDQFEIYRIDVLNRARAVPEPSTLLLLGGAIALARALGAARRHR